MVKDLSNAAEVSRRSALTSLTGEMSSEGDIRVDGKVSGKLTAKGKIVAGEGAVINGILACSNIDCWGTIEGDIYVSELLALKSTAVITGHIYTRKLQVEIGAQINGSCHMIISDEEFEKLINPEQ